MMRRVYISLFAGLLVVAGLSPNPAGFGSRAAAQSQEDIDKIAQQIEDIDALVSQAEGERTQALEELAVILAELEEANAELEAGRQRVLAVETEIADNEQRRDDTIEVLDRLSIDLAETRLKVEDRRDVVRDRAVEMYMDRSMNFGEALLGVGDVAGVSLGIEYAGQVIESSEELLNSLEVLERTEQRQQDEIVRKKLELEELLANLEVKKVELVAEREALELVAAEVTEKADAAEAIVAAINAEIAAFEHEKDIAQADIARIEEEIRRKTSGGGGTNPGVLSWPVGGSVTSGFGWRTHPISGASKFHAGIDISAGSGTPISAAGSGTVIVASWYGGYGNTVVIDHGGGLTSLYAHQSSLAVSNGQSVSKGQTIGYVGSTGYSTGPHLHFETRENGTPVNPLNYLNG